MGQSLNCFSKTSSLTLAGDLSDFPEEFKNQKYHQTEDPYKDSRVVNTYSNEDEDKHILVHDNSYIGFETGKGLYRQCLPLWTNIRNKTMKVEGNKLVVVDAQPVEDTKTVEDANTGWRSSNGGIKF